MRRQDHARLKPLPRQCANDAPCHETGIAFLIQMLQPAPAARREMDAGRRRMVDTEVDGSIAIYPVARRSQGKVAAVGGYPVAFRRDADDAVYVAVAHNRAAIAAASARSKSSAMKAAPLRRAASP